MIPHVTSQLAAILGLLSLCDQNNVSNEYTNALHALYGRLYYVQEYSIESQVNSAHAQTTISCQCSWNNNPEAYGIWHNQEQRKRLDFKDGFTYTLYEAPTSEQKSILKWFGLKRKSQHVTKRVPVVQLQTEFPDISVCLVPVTRSFCVPDIPYFLKHLKEPENQKVSELSLYGFSIITPKDVFEHDTFDFPFEVVEPQENGNFVLDQNGMHFNDSFFAGYRKNGRKFSKSSDQLWRFAHPRELRTIPEVAPAQVVMEPPYIFAVNDKRILGGLGASTIISGIIDENCLINR